MPAPAGNLNAEKWTLDHTNHLLDQIADLVDEDDVHYMGQALGICDAYAELWSRLKKKWQDDDDIIHRMRVLEQKFESKIVCGSMTGRYKAGAARLVLQHYHGYEKKEQRDPKKTQEEEFQEIVADVEAVVGPLCDDMKTGTKSQEIIRIVHGATMEQLTEAGFMVQKGYIYPPDHPRLKIDDEYHMF